MAARKSRSRRRSPSGIRLADIAARAGVSTATVSRALNEPDKVSPDLRQRVLDTVDELNWVPHAAAKALASHRTRTIGVIMAGSLGHENMAHELEALQKHLAAAGYSVLLAFSELDDEQELAQTRVLLERGVDALVLHSESHHEKLWRLLEVQKTPVVFTRTATGLPGYTTVGYDMYAAFAQLAQHLLDLEHEQFGMMLLTTPQQEQQQIPEPDLRVKPALAGVSDKLASRGLSIRTEHITSTWFSVDKGLECCRQIMAATPRPTALICMNDYMAIGAMLECQAMGLHVPNDISIVGFDDIEWAALCKPPLTTVRAPDAAMGQATAECILDAVAGVTAAPTRHELEVELVLRASTGPAPGT